MVRRRLPLLLVVLALALRPGLPGRAGTDALTSSGASVPSGLHARPASWALEASNLAAAPASPAAGPGPRPSAFPAGSQARQLQDVLDARAAAVRTRDRAAFLRTVDPAERPFAEAQAAWFDRLAPVPLAAYDLELSEEHAELTRTRDRTRYGIPVVVAPVDERLRFDGYGDLPVTGTLYLTFVRREGRWRVASDTDGEDLGLVGSRHPWDFGDVAVHRSEHFLLLMHPDQERYAASLLAQAEQALPAVGRVWPDPWNAHLPLEVPSSAGELSDYLGGGIDVSKFVAFALSSVDPRNGWRWEGARMVVNSGLFLAQPPAVRTAILAHELTHVATETVRGSFGMTFLDEGIADLAAGKMGGPRLDRQVRTGRFNRRLPEDFEFVSGTPEEIQTSYEKASSALAFMRSRFGIEGVERFFKAYGSAKLAPGTDRYHVDQAFRAALGLTLGDFERQWAQQVAPTP
ncbi:MAG TPA: hypothetical protein VII47_03345 [Actinomycetota bacterium]|jgi:hypothetical protein